MISKRFLAIAVLVATSLCLSEAKAQLTFNISSTGNAQADAGFALAATYWTDVFDDNITINIDAGFATLGNGVLGQAGSAPFESNYSTVRNALTADATNALDTTFANSLTTGSTFDVYINRTSDNPNGNGSAVPYVAVQDRLRFTRANAKAIGLVGANAAGTDAAITFNSSFNFDFDPTDGITAGQFDFVGVAAHELGHALGFTSGVDLLAANTGRPANQSEFSTILDLARHSPDSVAAGAMFDATADAREKFVSFDGGATAGAPGLAHFSTGVQFGDGRQASHWKDNLGLGILDPTAAPPGQLNVVTELDIRAFDVIGYNRISAVPEPSGLLMLSAFCVAGILRRRRA